MAYANPYATYKETGVRTASPGRLIVMLYAEAVKQLEHAESLFVAEDSLPPASIEKLNSAVIKTQEILSELMMSLDMERGGEIARNLMALYTFFTRELMDANIGHDVKKLKSVRTMMESLLSAWEIAAETCASPRTAEYRTNIDIMG